MVERAQGRTHLAAVGRAVDRRACAGGDAAGSVAAALSATWNVGHSDLRLDRRVQGWLAVGQREQHRLELVAVQLGEERGQRRALLDPLGRVQVRQQRRDDVLAGADPSRTGRSSSEP